MPSNDEPLDIQAWLSDLGLERYAEAFRKNEIDVTVLAELTADDLKDIGVMAVGHRRRLLSAIELLATPLDGPAESPPQATPDTQARPAAVAERRQLTVMFVDLVGSTAMSGRLDPEEMGEVIRAYQDAVASETRRFGGHVAKFMGDGVLAYFGFPQAHEDDAERSVRSALAIMQAMDELTAPDGTALAARIGIATGLVVVGDLVGEAEAQERAVVGETPNLAARLQGVAAPDQIVLAETTRQLLGDFVVVENLGAHDLKGIAAPTRAFTVRGERALESRFEARQGDRLAQMVGRDQELALLLERWRQAKAGEGQLVLLTGEAGIGKSRIARALIDAVADDEHVRINYQCSPYHTDSALYPAIQQLTRAAGFGEADMPDARLDKLERLLGQAVADPAEDAPIFASLLGLEAQRYGALALTPQQLRLRLLEALSNQLTGLATKQPVHEPLSPAGPELPT